MLNYEETIRIYFNDVEEIELFSKYKLYLNNGSVLVGSFGFEEINEPYFEMENLDEARIDFYLLEDMVINIEKIEEEEKQ